MAAEEQQPGNRSPAPGAAAAPPLRWKIEPISFALDAAGRRRESATEHGNRQKGTPDPSPRLCSEVGRRLLLAQFEFSGWVLRRVEKVSFVSDRRVSRRSSIELRVRDDAPVLLDESGKEYWLIPLSVMRRRTLVNFDLRDEDGNAISLMGLRFTQKLDEAMLDAAATLVPDELGPLPDAVTKYISDAVSGMRSEVKKTKDEYAALRADKESELGKYLSGVFAATLERLWHNFTLYAALPVTQHRHRVLRLSFEERVDWRHQKPVIDDHDPERVLYRPMKHHVRWKELMPQHFGLKPTRIRFLTPSAENCASYHFEFTAPTGLSISRAALLAGRPNRAGPDGYQPDPSWDVVENSGQSAGLHAVEIPNGSLCRTQIDLRIPSRGWLSTLMVSGWAIAIVLASVLFQVRRVGDSHQWNVEQVTNIVLLLVTVSAGAATYVTQHHAVDLVARMVTGLRGVGAAAISFPAVAALLLVYLDDGVRTSSKQLLWWWVGTLLVLSVVCALVLSSAWFIIRVNERLPGRPSRWDMTDLDDDHAPMTFDKEDFATISDGLGFRDSAVGVASAEGWHEVHAWDNHRQASAVATLIGSGANPTGCTCTQPGHRPLAEVPVSGRLFQG